MVGSSAQTKADCLALPTAVQIVGSLAQMKADCWAQTKATEINLEKKLTPLLVGMRWKVMNWAHLKVRMNHSANL